MTTRKTGGIPNLCITLEYAEVQVIVLSTLNLLNVVWILCVYTDVPKHVVSVVLDGEESSLEFIEQPSFKACYNSLYSWCVSCLNFA